MNSKSYDIIRERLFGSLDVNTKVSMSVADVMALIKKGIDISAEVVEKTEVGAELESWLKLPVKNAVDDYMNNAPSNFPRINTRIGGVSMTYNTIGEALSESPSNLEKVRCTGKNTIQLLAHIAEWKGLTLGECCI